MKNKIFILILMLMCCFRIHADYNNYDYSTNYWDFYFYLGTDISNFSDKSLNDNVGIYLNCLFEAKYNFTKQYSVKSGLGFSIKGLQTGQYPDVANFTNMLLYIPMLFSYNIKNLDRYGFSLIGGVNVNFNLYSQWFRGFTIFQLSPSPVDYTDPQIDNIYQYINQTSLNTYNLSIVIGFDYDYKFLSYSLRLSYDLFNNYSYPVLSTQFITLSILSGFRI